ncbi:hypothetical protein HYS93_00660 [Candidatus Daviesbacteria bacterium]|nr:hypothetical protein [Candidatus Daviesbacteria bacterium]
MKNIQVTTSRSSDSLSPAQLQILNISVNLARIGNWVADSYEQKKELINKFIEQTAQMISDLDSQNSSKEFKTILSKFKTEFYKLKEEPIDKTNKPIWAEKALTWANILQHRAKLA